jgi:hypothetical protein
MMRKVIFFLAVLILSFSIYLIVVAQTPIVTITSSFSFPGEIKTADGIGYQLPAYTLVLSNPATVKKGVIAHVNADLTDKQNDQPSTLPVLTDKFTVSVEVRFDLINGVVEPSGLIHTLLQPWHPLHFTWNLKTDQLAPLSGTIWLYLQFDPNSASGATEEKAIFAIPMDYSVQSVLGMNIDVAVFFAVFEFLISIGLLIFVFSGWLKKKKSKKMR